MFASINDYPYSDLINIMRKGSRKDLHEEETISYLF